MSVMPPYESTSPTLLELLTISSAIVGVVWLFLFIFSWLLLRKRISWLKLASLTLLAAVILFIIWIAWALWLTKNIVY